MITTVCTALKRVCKDSDARALLRAISENQSVILTEASWLLNEHFVRIIQNGEFSYYHDVRSPINLSFINQACQLIADVRHGDFKQYHLTWVTEDKLKENIPLFSLYETYMLHYEPLRNKFKLSSLDRTNLHEILLCSSKQYLTNIINSVFM